MNVFIDEIAKRAFEICDKLGITKPSHREMFASGYREGLRVNPWRKVSEELPKDTCEVLICWETTKHERKWTKLAMFRRHADNPEIWYFEDSDDGVVTPDYWMEIPEIKED